MSCSYVSKDPQGHDEKSAKKQTFPMLWSDLFKDHCRRDEKHVKKQPSAAMLSCHFNDHCRLEDYPDWSMMLADILEQISDHLSLLDFISFRSVCKQWRSSPSSRTQLFNFSKYQPWLIIYDPEKNKTGTPKCYIYSQSHPQCCTLKLHDLEGAVIVESKFNWLLAHHGPFFFLYNPFTFSRINLPKHNISGYYCCTFTYHPTHRECTISIVNRMNDSSLKLSMCRVGDKDWNTQTISDISSSHFGRSMRVSTCNHANEDLCTNLCPYAKIQKRIFIFDLEKTNKMWYKFREKQKVVVYDCRKEEMPIEYKLRCEKMISELKEMRSMHEKEWWKRSEGRYISVTFGGDKVTGTFLV